MDYSRITHLLLDLDGTLLHFDLDIFISRYLELIKSYFPEYQNKGLISSWILEGTSRMLNNEGEVTNRKVFLDYFCGQSGLSREVVWQRFISFYENDFNRLERIINQNPKAVKFLEAAQSAGFSLIIATQPVFPEIAIRKRLKWAGLRHIEFKMITDISRMKACKPHAIYFSQILEFLNVDPDRCLMVGDDPVNDMASSKVGIANYFIGVTPEESGNFETLAAYLQLSY